MIDIQFMMNSNIPHDPW